jgi:hypothetical protein
VIEVENRRIDGEIQTGLFEFCGKVPDKFGRVSRLALLELLSKLTSAPFHFHLINEAARILYEVILIALSERKARVSSGVWQVTVRSTLHFFHERV